MKIVALSILLSTSILVGMQSQQLSQEEIAEYVAHINQLRAAEKAQRMEMQKNDKRAERIENPLTRFVLAIGGSRKFYDGPHFDVTYLWEERNTGVAMKASTSWSQKPKVIVTTTLTVTGAKSIAAVKAEIDKIAQQCWQQESKITAIAANTRAVIADQFASATFTINNDQLVFDINAQFPSEEVHKHWSDYEKYIPYK